LHISFLFQKQTASFLPASNLISDEALFLMGVLDFFFRKGKNNSDVSELDQFSEVRIINKEGK
jgi:hypothetical protein